MMGNYHVRFLGGKGVVTPLTYPVTSLGLIHMHPNAFLRTFWQLEVKPQIFVAMSFAPEYNERYKEVIAPAISSIRLHNTSLIPYRVDISKSGDSILTDIIEGVSHSQMVLADVSTIGKDSKSGESYRNGNVMYEVGLAIACRHPSEVLLIRDDKDRFLFDVSTVPHMHLDFTDIKKARDLLQVELMARLREQNYLADARIKLAVASLTNHEIKLLSELAELPEGQVRGWDVGGTVLSVYEAAIMRLLDKQLIILAGKFDKGYPGYSPTRLGRVVAKIAKSGLRQFASLENPQKSTEDEQPKHEGTNQA